MNTLTIITVTKDDCEQLKTTLESVRREKVDGVEYIVIDGESKDKSKSLLMESSDIVNKYISEGDKGIYDAMNKGLQIASNEYVMFLNSGDELKGLKKIISDICDSSFTSCSTLLYGSEFTWSESISKIIVPKFAFCQMPTSHQAMIFHTKTAQSCSYDIAYKFSADYDLYLKIHQKMRCGVRIFNDVVVKTAPVGFTQTSILEYLKECYYINLKYNGQICALSRYFFELLRFQFKIALNFLLSESIIAYIRRLRGSKK